MTEDAKERHMTEEQLDNMQQNATIQNWKTVDLDGAEVLVVSGTYTARPLVRLFMRTTMRFVIIYKDGEQLGGARAADRVSFDEVAEKAYDNARDELSVIPDPN